MASFSSLNSGEKRPQRSYEAVTAGSDGGESFVVDGGSDEVPGADDGVFDKENGEDYEELLLDD